MIRKWGLWCLLITVCARWAVPAQAPSSPESTTAGPLRVYDHLLDPRVHPDYERRHVQPPSWDTFGNRTHFVTLRGFGMQDNTIVGYAEELEKYTVTYGLGDVVWPSYSIIFGENLDELANEIKRRDLFLFDIWGYVPGSGPGGYWQQYKVAPEVFPMLESTLGERWLGMDVGEQDGRYVGGYANQMYPIADDRIAQYLNFQRHFEAMCDELGNKMSTLVSLNFGHYFLKEGVYTFIGAETAQGLPNGQVYYSFIRAAGKQYGVPWFGNASVWNRWGYKSYDGEGADHGATKGTSLSLLKRLLYSHILYNCMFAGFESGWLNADGLTPIGRIQQAAVEWSKTHGQPGVMLTPVALMTDFYAGWSFPRHLYTADVLRVWGNLPYEPGDYLTDGALNLFYPGYQDSSFFHNERGFLTPTPFGDSVDCLLSDAPGWVLSQYPVLVIAGGLRGDAELRDKLEAYVNGGGHLAITAGNLAPLGGSLCGVSVSGPGFHVERSITSGPGNQSNRDHDFDLLPLAYPAEATVLQSCQVESGETVPAAVRLACGQGQITVLASPFGIAAKPVEGVIHNDIDRAYATPYPLLAHVRAVLEEAAAEQCLFDAPEGLSLITCRRAPGEYTLGLCNNGLTPKPFAIVSRCGTIESVEELPLDRSEKTAAGYLPTGLDGTDVGASSDSVVAGGDVRVFRVRVREERVESMPVATPSPRPAGRILPLRECTSIKEAVLTRPTFFEHFDGVSIDWRYLRNRDAEALAREAGWIARQSLRVYVDCTSGINLYPDLRMVNNDPQESSESMEIFRGLFDKMSKLGTTDIILSLHRHPENNFTGEQTRQSFEETLRTLCADAAARGITVYLRTTPKTGESINAVVALMDRIAAPNLRWAASTAMLVEQKANASDVAALLKDRPGLWLASMPAHDAAGKAWTMNASLAENPDTTHAAEYMAAAPGEPVLLDGVYANWDEEYGDVRCVGAR